MTTGKILIVVTSSDGFREVGSRADQGPASAKAVGHAVVRRLGADRGPAPVTFP